MHEQLSYGIIGELIRRNVRYSLDTPPQHDSKIPDQPSSGTEDKFN